MRPAGGNHALLKKWSERWEVSTDHFDPYAASVRRSRARQRPLVDILVEKSTYSRRHLKERLYREGVKSRECELCGQGELWRGKQLSLILDHVNGVSDDNRLENLRIVCPNCAATFDTHCGRNVRRIRRCLNCGDDFAPEAYRQRFCSRVCFGAFRRETAGTPAPTSTFGIPQPHRRKVPRPPLKMLVAETGASGFLAVGRKYGVSDNAIRKWIRSYEREAVRRARDGVEGS